MQVGKGFVGQLGRAVETAQLFAVLDDLDGGIATNAADELEFGGVTTVEVEDGVFLDMLGETEPDGVSPERVFPSESVVLRLPGTFPFGATHGVRYAEGVIPLFAFGSPLGIAQRIDTSHGVLALFPRAVMRFGFHGLLTLPEGYADPGEEGETEEEEGGDSLFRR